MSWCLQATLKIKPGLCRQQSWLFPAAHWQPKLKGGQGCTVPAGTADPAPCHTIGLWWGNSLLPLRAEQARKGCLGQSKAVSLAQLYSVSCKHLQKPSRCLWSPDPGMGSRIQPTGNIPCQEHEQEASQASSHYHQTSSGRRQTKPPLSSTPFPLTAASGRQHESRKIFAEGKGGFFFFPAPLYRPIWLWRYGKVSLPKQVSLSKTYCLISWSCRNLRVGCASWFLAHSYISGNFCPSLTSIIGSLWHTALQDLNRLLFFPYTERELCARDSLNCTAQPFINGLNNEQSI